MNTNSKTHGPARAPAVSDYDMMFEVAQLIQKSPTWTDASHMSVSVPDGEKTMLWHPIHSVSDARQIEDYLISIGFKVTFEGVGKACKCTLSRDEKSTTSLPGERNRVLCKATIDSLRVPAT